MGMDEALNVQYIPFMTFGPIILDAIRYNHNA